MSIDATAAANLRQSIEKHIHFSAPLNGSENPLEAALPPLSGAGAHDENRGERLSLPTIPADNSASSIRPAVQLVN